MGGGTSDAGLLDMIWPENGLSTMPQVPDHPTKMRLTVVSSAGCRSTP